MPLPGPRLPGPLSGQAAGLLEGTNHIVPPVALERVDLQPQYAAAVFALCHGCRRRVLLRCKQRRRGGRVAASLRPVQQLGALRLGLGPAAAWRPSALRSQTQLAPRLWLACGRGGAAVGIAAGWQRLQGPTVA